ncbi:MAG: hypothetical protein IOD12_08115 [Silvanigrellales bacterium]|nr:hypothetical protein [Silvanigrellales bacterium]
MRDPDDKDTVLGTTPFFLAAGRARNLRLQVNGIEGRGTTRYRFQCGFRWTSTLLGNAPLATFALFSNPLGGAIWYSLGLTVDVFTGAAYQCPERYLLDPTRGLALNPARPPPLSQGDPSVPLVEKKVCKRYFVVPPYHPDEVVSRAYEGVWRLEFAKSLGPCDELVAIDDSRSLLLRYNITHERAFDDISNFSVAQTNTFGYRTQATHFVLLRAVGARVGVAQESLQFQWLVYDLHSRAKTSDGTLSATPTGASVLERAFWRRALSWTVGLVPNSVGFALGDKDLELSGVSENGVSASNARDKQSLPALVSNWTLLSVYHPYQYSTWALDFDFKPEAISYYFAREMDLDLPDGSRILDYQSDGFYLLGLANFVGTLHTPAGAFSLGGGLGPAFIAVADSEGYRNNTLRMVRALQANYTAFMTENVFLRAGVIGFDGNDTIDTGYVRFRVSAMTSLTLGVFTPEARSWLRSLL